MKKNKLFAMANKIVSFIFITFIIFSCNSKVASSNDKDSDINPQIDSYCNIHNKDCEKIAKDMDMTIDEYHIWVNNQQSEIELEGEMTDENGDLVDPNSSISSENQNIEKHKQWVNCENCHGAGLKLCYECGGKGEHYCGSCNGTGSKSSTTGPFTCVDCNGRGVASCRKCYGKGTLGNCGYCNGRGQVLIDY
jgi:hypothetical protein